MKNIILTRRQIEIGSCLVQGMLVKDIAHQFGLSICTVRAHQRLIQKKLSSRNAYQAGYQLATFLNLEAEKLKNYL
jgi:DNA-binding NarL/FixJ family response regulator